MSWEGIRLKYLLNEVDSRSVDGNEQLHSLSKVSGVKPREIGSKGASEAESYVGYKRFSVGDVIMNKMQAWNGVFGLASSSGIVSPDYSVLRPKASKVDPRFLAELLRTPLLSGIFSGLSRGMGTAFNRLNVDALGSVRVDVPPLEEQRRIADFLDAETARIDNLQTRRRGQIASLLERQQSAISEVLIPGILTEPLREYPWFWLPDLPSTRRLVRLGYVARLQNGVTIDGGREVNVDMVTRPYLRVANVQAGHLDLDHIQEVAVTAKAASRSTLRNGDVLMTEGGDLDKLGRGTVWRGEIAGCLHQNHVFAVRPEVGRLDSDYLALMTMTVHGRCYFESTGVKTTNLASTNSAKILNFPVPLPALSEQKRLVAQAYKEIGQVKGAVHLAERQVALLSERRQALITAAVTGEIDVSTASGRGIEE